MYDVIVIGAGPTGSSAAKELAAHGYHVLLVEQCKLPRNKSCSGILIPKSVQLVSAYFHEEVPVRIMCTPYESKGMIFINDDGVEHRYEQSGLNIWRHAFDNWLVEKAVQFGAEIRDETIALSCDEQDGIVSVRLKGSSEYTEQARVVILGNGTAGSIRRKLLGQQQESVITYQTFNTGTIDLDPGYFYAYLQPQFSEYDAWFNVKDDYLILGTAVRDSRNIEHYYSQFIAYMKNQYGLKIEGQEKTERWLMPLVTLGCPIDYGKGRIFFAGETAGFLNPMGEGISASLESGYAVAKAIQQIDLQEDSAAPTIHAAYKTNIAELKTYMERQWRFVASISPKFACHKNKGKY